MIIINQAVWVSDRLVVITISQAAWCGAAWGGVAGRGEVWRGVFLFGVV